MIPVNEIVSGAQAILDEGAGEEWRYVPGTEETCAVSNLGRVMNLSTKRILKPRRLPTGYLRASLPKKYGMRDAYIHRLVAEAFCDHPDGCDVINHLDNDVTNNRADNLEWTTQRGNVLYAMDQGRVPKFPNAKEYIGEKGGIIRRFKSSHEAAEYAGCAHSTILRSCRTGKRAQNGYRWEVVTA